MTWAQAREASRRAARSLDAAGLEPGDRFAVLTRDAIEYLLLCVASRAGVVAVTLDPRTPAGWDRIVVESEAMLLVLGSGFDGVRLPAMPVVDVDELWGPGPPAAPVLAAGAPDQPGTDTGSATCRNPA